MMRWNTSRLVSIAGSTPPSPGRGQHHGRGGFRHIRRVGHRDAGFGLAQRGSIVDAVSAHPDHLAPTLKPPDQPELVFRKHAGKNTAVERVAAQIAMELFGRANVAWNPHLLGHAARRDGVVARDHDDADAGVADRTHDGLRILAHGVLKPQQTHEAHLARGSFGHPKHTLPAPDDEFSLRLPNGVSGAGQFRDHCGGAFHESDARPALSRYTASARLVAGSNGLNSIRSISPSCQPRSAAALMIAPSTGS